MRTTHEAKRAAAVAANDDRLQLLARLGYAAKGLFYAVIGTLALQLAFGRGGETTDSRGAIEHIGSAPFGKFLLVLVALGLVGLMLWRMLQATLDLEGHGEGAKGWVKRGALAVSGLIYGGLLLATVRLLTQGRSTGSNTASLTARIMEAPAGRIAVGVAGVALALWGLGEVAKGVKGKLSNLRLQGVAARQAQLVKRISRFGLIARGAVFTLMGGFLVQAAVRFDPSEAKGLGETLGTVAQRPMGDVLLGVTAAGLLAYALYALLEARYRTLGART